MKNKFRYLLCVICIIVFFFSIGYLVYKKYPEFKEIQLIKKVQLKKEKTQKEIIIKHETDEPKLLEEETVKAEKIIKEPQILIEYKSLYEDNDELYGWIRIKNTIINYPVMYTPEKPNFYIHRNWEKEESVSGSIYVDGRCTKDSENLIIYGHNMKDRTMFGSLREYKDREFFEKHKYIEFDTIYEKSQYEIISVSKAIIYYDIEPNENEYLFYEHVELDSEEEFNLYIENIKKQSYYEIGTSAQYGDKLITLCTCDYWTENARLIIIAKKI